MPGAWPGFLSSAFWSHPLPRECRSQPGDIVTEVNGVRIENPQQGMAVLRKLMNASEINLTVIRNGEPVQVQQRIGG